MTSAAIRPTLYVEGPDDLHSIVHLVQRHGLNMVDKVNRPFDVQEMDSDTQLLDAMPDAVRNATDRPIGFVLDIDTATPDRWQAVCGRLVQAGLSPPPMCPPTGYIDHLPAYRHPVGVWMMPDCVRAHGTLEHLLQSLVPTPNALWQHADSATAKATVLGATFRPVDKNKALLSCWLAWQSTPGLPYGTAIKAHFFNHDSAEALGFVQWIKALFGPAALAPSGP